jgi:hypothetical protein
MSTPQDERDDDRDAVSLSVLAPREDWVRGLPALGRSAARLRASSSEESAWSNLAATGRWLLPLATAGTVACWVLVARGTPPSEALEPSVASIAAGTASNADVARYLITRGGAP